MNKNKAILVALLSTLVFTVFLPPMFLALAFQDKPVLTDAQKKLVANTQDTVRSADRAVVAAEEARRSADGKVTAISSLIAFDSADETAMRELEELADTLDSITRLGLLTTLDSRDADLTRVKADVTTARDALPAESAGEAEEFSAARKAANAVAVRIDRQVPADAASKKKLTDLLATIPGKVKLLAGLFPTRLAVLADIPRDATADALIPVVPEQFPDLTEVERLRHVLRERWNEVSTALEGAGSKNAGDNAKVVEAIDDIDAQTVGILKNLKPWLDTLTGLAQAETAKTSGLVPKLIGNPVLNSPEASLQVSSSSGLHANFSRFSANWITLAAQLRGQTIPGFDALKTTQSAQALAEADKTLNIAVAVLQDALTGDASEFIADQVSLYYYTDVPAIMHMLNAGTFQVGGVKGAQEQAALERRKLTEAEMDLVEAQAEVNKDQRRVLELQEELRQAKAGFASSETVLLKASRNLRSVQADDQKNQDRLTKAKTDADAAPTDPEKQLALQRASDDADKSAARLKASELRNEDATRERDADKERSDALTNEQTGLPTKIQQARDALEAAQSAVTRQRRSAFLAAQIESDAFVMARDNTPFWFGPAIAASRDPVKRVLLYAFNNSKTIFLRGKPEDVAVVKDIIARFDSPAPQARLTLWTMEMSSDTSPKGTEHFNKALIVIEEELANDRALTAASISYLRDCVNDEVNRVGSEHVADLDKLCSDGKNCGLSESDRPFLARLYFYHPEVRARLGFQEKELKPKEGNGDKESNDRQRDVARFARFSLPDPAGTTTLGETLMVLSLGTRYSRMKIMNNFQADLRSRLKALNLNPGAELEGDSWKTDPRFFTLTYRVLGLDGPSGSYEPLTTMQEEITRALERLMLQKVKQAVETNMGEIRRIEAHEKDLKARSLEQGLKGRSVEQLQLEAARTNLVRRTLPLINFVRERFGLNPGLPLSLSITSSTDATANETAAQKEARKQNEIMGEMKSFTAQATELNPLRSANARTAAADQMLKEIMIAVEDDIEHHFVQRMLNRLRKKITLDKSGVGVGVMQRTSMLATNRLIARVDPRASAQLGVGEEQNILQSVQQLAQIFTAAQTGGVLGTLGALDKQPRQPPPEIYGINSGNNFQVTPIFDPSGQALRFKFDFVGATRIQEPNGTTNPQLPRIERHTVNTEVQLSNLELREISRFESNSRIGLPTTYSGGLPIIRDIPKIRPYLPLLGWFVRKGGKAAVVQQSLIFGQTTMYPTIADIMDLLTAPVSTQ